MNVVVSVLGLAFCTEGLPAPAGALIGAEVMAPTPVSTILDTFDYDFIFCRQLASATAGIVSECIPILIPPWEIGSLTVKANMIPVLTWESMIFCAVGGNIHILEPGSLVIVV